MAKWQESYSKLKEFISHTPQIEIDKSCVVIPGDVRPEFNRLFDTVRVAFLEEKYPAMLEESLVLSRNYAKADQQLTNSVGLSEIKVPITLKSLISDPVSGLTRYLFDPLFDLIKGKVDDSGFECQSAESLESSFAKVFRLGYEKWVLLSIMNLLSPDKALAVPAYPIETSTRELEPDEKRGIFKVEIPAPEETKLLSFDRAGDEPAFILSDIVLSSARLGRYVAIRTDLRDASYSAKDVSAEREWLHLREVAQLYKPTFIYWPDIVMCVGNQPEDIALVADFSRFCRPDIIVECMEQKDWYQTDGLGKVKREYDFFKPRLGTFIVSRLPVPGETLRELISRPAGEPGGVAANEQSQPVGEPDRNIHVLTVGYEESALNPIVEVLRKARSTG